jgi:putative ABC transport system permease protein
LMAGDSGARRPVPAVVDERFVQRFFPDENPLGRRFGLSSKEDDRYEIVGVAANSRYDRLRGTGRPTVYEPYTPSGTIHFAIRSTIDPAALAGAVQRAVVAVDPAVPLTEFHTQNGLIHRMLRTERLLSLLSGVLGAIALVVSAIGLAGVLAYAVACRTSEIGLRVALGAQGGDVARMVLGDSLRLVGTGILVGLPAAYAAGRVLETSLFQIEPLHPGIALFSAAVLSGAALLAAWIPARRAARIDPLAALREQ